MYVRPVENVVVAELNFEKSAADRQPKVEAFAVLQFIVGCEPSTKAEEPLVTVMPVPLAIEEVATEAKVLTPVAYKT